jgi:hypothetical protein
VPETLRTSCCLLIFVEEAAEAVVSLDLVDVGRRALGEWPCGSCLPERSVWTVIVVMECELAQRDCGVSLVDDQKTVEEFAAEGADEAFGDRVRPWRAHRRLDDLTSMAAVNLLSRSRMRNRNSWWASSRSMTRLRA